MVKQGYKVSTPPQTLRAWPEIFAPPAEDRNRHIAAISLGLTIRRSETLPKYVSRISSKLTPVCLAREKTNTAHPKACHTHPIAL